MKRRTVLAAGVACGACLAIGRAFGQAPHYAAPDRFTRPDIASDEGGLWALMDREEKALRRSPLVLRDAALARYVQEIACRLGGTHCPDIRSFVVRTPQFNASMAPNGMMQVWTGLLLRMENEAQLAAVIGHEIGHYLQRHSIDRLRDIKSKSAVGQVLGLFGLVGALGQIAVAASIHAYSRDHEHEADRIGAVLMHQAGYDVAEAAKVWNNLLQEARAREGKEPEETAPLFASHPAPPERRSKLEEIAAALPGGGNGGDLYRQRIAPHLDEWLQDEVKRGQYEESLALFSRQVNGEMAPDLVRYYRGEIYRLRAKDGDLDRALADYQTAAQASNPPALAYRGIGLICRQQGRKDEALQNLRRYLELAPAAPDAAFIQSYLAELAS